MPKINYPTLKIAGNVVTGAFSRRVLAVVKQIPPGQVLTHRQVAIRAGRPHAYRAVGAILGKNYDPAIPCHRVIRSDGNSGGYNRGRAEKLRRLAAEGRKIE